MKMTSEIFMEEISKLIKNAREAGLDYLDITSGDLHRKVGGYPGRNHSMPTCCNVMRSLMKPNDEVLQSPLKGKGATLTIRYYL